MVGLCGFDALEAGENYAYVRSWGVAGALMEKCPSTEVSMVDPGWFVEAESHAPQVPVFKMGRDESLTRAIIEACCEALT